MSIEKELSFLRSLPLRILSDKPLTSQPYRQLGGFKLSDLLGHCSSCEALHEIDWHGYVGSTGCPKRLVEKGQVACPDCGVLVWFIVEPSFKGLPVKVLLASHLNGERQRCAQSRKSFEVYISVGVKLCI